MIFLVFFVKQFVFREKYVILTITSVKLELKMEDMILNKSELIRAISDKTGITQKDVDVIFKAYVDVVAETLKKGEKIALPGFCSYEVKNQAARTAINPATQEKVNVPARKVPVCKLGKAFKDQF